MEAKKRKLKELKYMVIKSKIIVCIFFLCLGLSAKGQMRLEGRDLELHEIAFTKKFIRSFMDDSIPNMAKAFGMNNEWHVLCVNFLKPTDTIFIYPRHLKYGITEWFLYTHKGDIIGYFVKDKVRVLVLCEDIPKYKKYFKKKKKKVTLHIECNFPSNEAEFPYKEYSFNPKDKSIKLIEENIPQGELLLW